MFGDAFLSTAAAAATVFDADDDGVADTGDVVLLA